MNVYKISDILSQEDFSRISAYFYNIVKDKDLTLDSYGRKLIDSYHEPILSEYSNKFLPIVRDIFNDQSILPSYSLFAEYCGETITLDKHKDANACTYTVDLVLYQNEPWSLWIDGNEYSANPNEAILFMGEDSVHWRETIYDNKDRIGVIFFHYVKPDHWFFTKGRDYVEEVRKRMREERM